MYERDVYWQVAKLHEENINKGFLSSLGTSFLALLYEAIDANESSFLLIAKNQGRVVGFVSGTEGMRSIYRQLLNRWPRLFMALFPVLVSPEKWLKIAEILVVGKKTVPMSDLPTAELLSIAVDPSQRGQGHAQALYRELANNFRQRGFAGFRIVVGEKLATAHRFYRAMGAQPVGTIEVHRGQMSIVYVHRPPTELIW